MNTRESKRIRHFLQQSSADFSGLKERVGRGYISKRCGIKFKIWSNEIYSVVLCRDVNVLQAEVLGCVLNMMQCCVWC